MTLTLAVPNDLEARLAEEARRLGVSTEEYTLRVLNQHVPNRDRARAAVELLQSWMDEKNEISQKDAGESLLRSLDEDRPSERKLFPPELEGVTW